MDSKGFLKLSLPQRIDWLVKNTRTDAGRKVTVEQFADLVDVAPNTVYSWRRTVEPQEESRAKLVELAGRLGLTVRPEAFAKPPEEVVSLESVDRRLQELGDRIGLLTGLVNDALALLREGREQATPDVAVPDPGKARRKAR